MDLKTPSETNPPVTCPHCRHTLTPQELLPILAKHWNTNPTPTIPCPNCQTPIQLTITVAPTR